MTVTRHSRHPPALEELAAVIERSLQKNFSTAAASVVQCPDLRQRPFNLAAPGLCGNACIGDIGARENLFPRPNLNAKYSLLSLAEKMNMSTDEGLLIGAGAAPFQDIGQNAEFAANLSWQRHSDNTDSRKTTRSFLVNKNRIVKMNHDGSSTCETTLSTSCALMANLFGCKGEKGPVLKITAGCRKGKHNFTDCIRHGLHEAYGDNRPISLGGVFLLKTGKAKFHIMPDFPPEDKLPFPSREFMEKEWITYHVFDAPIVCLTVLHSSDPQGLGLRMEHTHCFELDGGRQGGHYHYDIQEGPDEVGYEAYFNVASAVYRIQ